MSASVLYVCAVAENRRHQFTHYGTSGGAAHGDCKVDRLGAPTRRHNINHVMVLADVHRHRKPHIWLVELDCRLNINIIYYKYM